MQNGHRGDPLLCGWRSHQQAIVVADDVVEHQLAGRELGFECVEEAVLAADRLVDDLFDELDDAVRGRSVIRAVPAFEPRRRAHEIEQVVCGCEGKLMTRSPS